MGDNYVPSAFAVKKNLEEGFLKSFFSAFGD